MEKEKVKKKKADKAQSSDAMSVKVKLASSKRVSGGNRVTVTVSLLDSAGNVISEDSDFVSLD